MAGGQIAGHYKTLIDPNDPWWRHPRLWKLMFWVGLYCLGNMANGYDGALVSGLQILPFWQADFNHPTGSTLGLLGAVQNIGSLGSIPVAPLWNDRFGRRKTIILGTIMMITGASLQAGAKNVNWFLGGRALLGFGGGFNNNADPLMVIELAYPSHRPILAGCYGSLTGVGSIVAAALTFGTYYIAGSWSWRLPALVQVLPTVFQMCMVMLGPESPRWLMSKGREQEAMDVLVYYHGKGDPHDPLVLYEFEEMKKAMEEEKANKVGSWISLWNTPGMRRRSLIMMTLALSGQWSGNGLVTYYLSPVLNTIGITDRTQQLGINLGLTVWNFCCGIFAGFSADKLGRRFILIMMTCLMLCFLIAVTICSAEYNLHKDKVSGAFVVVFIYLFTGCYAFGWPGIMLLYVTEIVPTSLRSKGHSLWAITQASFLVFNQYTNPIGFQSLGWKYYLVFDVVMIAILAFLYFFVVETKGLTLEETAILFDGEDAVRDLQDRADAQAAVDVHLTDVVHRVPEAGGDKSPGSEKGSFAHVERV